MCELSGLRFLPAEQAGTRQAPRLNFLRANSVLTEEERAVEISMRERAPQQYAQYEALQAQADVSWRLSHASDAAIAAIAKVVTLCRQCTLHLPHPSHDRRCLCCTSVLSESLRRQIWLLVGFLLPLYYVSRMAKLTTLRCMQFLAQKQATAIKARQAANDHTRQLRLFLQEGAPAAKRPRTL